MSAPINARLAYTVMKNHEVLTRGFWNIYCNGEYKGFVMVYGPANFKIELSRNDGDPSGEWKIIPNQTGWHRTANANAPDIPVETNPIFNTDSWNFVFNTDFGGSWTNVYNWMKNNSGRIKNLTGHGTWRMPGSLDRYVPYNGRILNLETGNEIAYGLKLTNSGIPLEWIVSNLSVNNPVHIGPSPIERIRTRIRGAKRFLYPVENGLVCYQVTKEYVGKLRTSERLADEQIEALVNAPALYIANGYAGSYTKC